MAVKREDILEALGVDVGGRFMTGLLVGVGLGALIGGAVALLFAPKSGEELRQDLSARGREYAEQLRSRMNQTMGTDQTPGTHNP